MLVRTEGVECPRNRNLTVNPPPPLPDLSLVVQAFANIPHSRLLRLRLDEIRHGSAAMSVAWDERLIGNPRTRVVHSGVITTLLDTLCGLVVMASVPDGTALATLDLRIDYLRPATPEETIRASAECYKVTNSIAFVRGTAFHRQKADAIAHCAGTFMLGGAGFTAGPPRTPASGANASGPDASGPDASGPGGTPC
jgi:uncharacterized protein (TIGR00369 family)